MRAFIEANGLYSCFWLDKVGGAGRRVYDVKVALNYSIVLVIDIILLRLEYPLDIIFLVNLGE